MITGATGNIGSEVIKLLSVRGIPFKAMVRSEKDAEAIAGLPFAETVNGDFNDPDSIAHALQGIEKAFLLTNSTEETERQQIGFTDAAKKAGVKLIVKQSQWAADEHSPVRFLRYHAAVEKKIRESGMAYTFLRPNLFMQGLLAFKQSIKDEGKFYAAVGDARISIVDIRDIAAVAVEALTSTGHENKIYNLTGSEAISHAEMAAWLSEALGKTVTFIDIKPEEMLQFLLSAKFPPWQAEGLVEDYAHYARGEAAIVTNDIKEATGKSPHDFRIFAKDYSGIFTL